MNKFVKHLTSLLFLGLALGQDSQDKLILKNGIEYLGRFEKKEEGVIFFKPAGDYSPQPIQENMILNFLFSPITLFWVYKGNEDVVNAIEAKSK